jgi:hypothetical protein
VTAHAAKLGIIARWLIVVAAAWSTSCARWTRSTSALPSRNALVREQLVVHSDFNVPAHHRLIDELTAQRGDLGTKLGLPTSDEPIHVYLFDNGERFAAFLDEHYPDFPARRAFFVEGDTRLAVYAHWGDRVAEDLRHEVAHGYLHSVLPNLPLWLDEGLAEYFEVPRGAHGLNMPHLAELNRLLATGGWRPNLARLETLATINDMSQTDYAESWAWAHLLLETAPERLQAVRDMLQSLRSAGVAQPMSQRLRQQSSEPEALLISHLQELASRMGVEPPRSVGNANNR